MLRSLLLALLLLLPVNAFAQTTSDGVTIERIETVIVDPDDAATLRVGVVEQAPFAMPGPNGAWVGIGVDLWRLIAEREGLAYEMVALDSPAIDALEQGTIDLALPMTPTAEAEGRADFSHAFYTATLGAAGVRTVDLWDTASAFLSWRFLRIVLGLSAILLVVGGLMWLIERRANPDQFGTTDDDVEDGDAEDAGLGRRTLRGLGSGFWWSGVTMTTIGYGDKAPVTTLGRAVAMVWMLVALGITSALTASIVAATDLSSAGTLKIPSDLTDKRVAAVEDSASAAYLDAEGLSYETFGTLAEALRAASADRVDAVVGPLPALRHHVDAEGLDLAVSPSRAEPNLMTIMLPDGSDLREPIDAAVLDLTTGSGWVALLDRYAPEN
ncbi:MAG: transporter substrate-binding domain-containing protein [Pseudomonadota bacterium]